MTIWLLLKDQQDGRGLAVGIKPPELAPDLPDSELDNLVVGGARFNGDSTGPAAQSVARGGLAALRLMARQYRAVWLAAPLKRLRVETMTPLVWSYDGRSGDLLYALATFLRLAELNGLVRAPAMDFAATGTLDPDGVVGPVGGVVAKIEAAIERLPRGSFIFYPKEKPEGETQWVDEALKERCRQRGIEPREVGFFEEALVALGIDILGWRRDQPPYRALSTYEVEHSPIFFGRDDQVTKFLDRLERAAEAKDPSGHTRPGGLVEAASGAGKSSFVQAGLLARLRILPRDDRSPVEYAVWQPRLAGAGQASEIDEAALTKSVLLNWKTHAGVNSTGFSGLDQLKELDTLESLGEALDTTALDGRLLVWVVDQFEELFTQKYTDAARIAFARFLAQLQQLGVWVIGTLRTEFKSRFMALADEQGNALLVDVFENLMFPLARMRDEAMGQMITEPAKVAGVGFETRADGVRLDELLREEALGADSMPLVGYALNELWLKRKSPDTPDELGRKTPQMTFAAYKVICGGQESGGIKRVLGIEAERALEKLPPEARDELPRLLDALAVPVEGEEKEAARPADLGQWEEGTPGWQLIEAMREKRLLITEPATDSTPARVRVVHEALFEGWDRAQEELAKSRELRTQIKRLTAKHDEWAAKAEAPDELLTSAADLELATSARTVLLQRPDMAKVQRYVDLSLERNARQRRRRRLGIAGLVLGVLVLATMLAVVAALYSKAEASANAEREARLEAQTETRRANEATSVASKAAAAASAAAAQAEIARNDEAAQRIIAIEQRRAAELQRARAEKSLATADAQTKVAQSERTLAQLEQSRAVSEAANSVLRDGDTFTAIDMTIGVLPVDKERPWSIAAESVLRQALLSNRVVVSLSGHTSAVQSVGFSPDGKTALTAADDNSVRLWKIGDKKGSTRELKWHSSVPLGFQFFSEIQFRAAFSPDGKSVLTNSLDGKLLLWDITVPVPTSISISAHARPVLSAAFSADGKKLVTSSIEDEIKVWDLNDLTNPYTLLRGHHGFVTHVAFSKDGQRILSASTDKLAMVWDISKKQISSIALVGHSDVVSHASFSPDGKYVATASLDKTVRIWNIEKPDNVPIVLSGHTKAINRLLFLATVVT